MIHTIDITKEHCPMTFVKTKIKLAQISSGEILEVLLKEGEPLENVPKSAAEQGYKILDTVHVKDNIYKLTIQK